MLDQGLSAFVFVSTHVPTTTYFVNRFDCAIWVLTSEAFEVVIAFGPDEGIRSCLGLCAARLIVAGLSELIICCVHVAH